MASRAEIDENGDTKGNMWVLEQKLNQPMNEEAGKLKNMYREKKFSAILLLRLAIQSLGVVYGDLGTSPFVSTLLMMVTLKKLDGTWCTVSLENACLQTLVGAAGEVTPYIVTWCSEATQKY